MLLVGFRNNEVQQTGAFGIYLGDNLTDLSDLVSNTESLDFELELNC